MSRKSAIVTVTENTLLVVNNEPLKSLRIFPNPTSTVINLRDIIGFVDRIEIYSITGQQVKRIESNFNKINAKTIEAGVYFSKISNKGQQKIIKFIKE